MRISAHGEVLEKPCFRRRFAFRTRGEGAVGLRVFKTLTGWISNLLCRSLPGGGEWTGPLLKERKILAKEKKTFAHEAMILAKCIYHGAREEFRNRLIFSFVFRTQMVQI